MCKNRSYVADSGSARKDLKFALTNMPALPRLSRFKIRNMARGRLKRDGDTFYFLRATFSFYLTCYRLGR